LTRTPRFTLRGTSVTPEGVAKFLVDHNGVDYTRLSGIGDEHIKMLVKAMMHRPSVRDLGLVSNGNLTMKGLLMLKGHENLSNLTIAGVKISNEELKLLRKTMPAVAFRFTAH